MLVTNHNQIGELLMGVAGDFVDGLAFEQLPVGSKTSVLQGLHAILE